MEKSGRPRKKPYFGWWIVLVGFLVMSLAFAPGQSMPGLFVKPLAEEFGVSRTLSALTQTIATAATMLGVLVAGRILARHNIKRIVTLALGVQVLCYIAFAAAPSLGVIFVASGVRGLANAFCTTLPASILINNWFGVKIRGRAWGITVVGSGIGSLAFTPVVGAIMAQWGWRMAYGFFGLLSLVLIPLVLLTYVRHPQDKGQIQIGQQLGPDGNPAKIDTSGIPARLAVRTKMFWVLLIAFFFLAGCPQMWNVNGAAYMSDLGFDVVTVSVLITLSSIGATVGKATFGIISDKMGNRFGVTLAFGALIAGVALAVVAQGVPGLLFPAVLIMGFGLCLPIVFPPLITRELYGNKDYSVLAGFTQSSLNLGASIMAMLASLVYDLSGSYAPAWLGICVLGVGVVLLIRVAYRIQPALAKKYWQP